MHSACRLKHLSHPRKEEWGRLGNEGRFFKKKTIFGLDVSYTKDRTPEAEEHRKGGRGLKMNRGKRSKGKKDGPPNQLSTRLMKNPPFLLQHNE